MHESVFIVILHAFNRYVDQRTNQYDIKVEFFGRRHVLPKFTKRLRVLPYGEIRFDPSRAIKIENRQSSMKST